VAGAQVSVRNVDTGVVRTAVSDADGSYRVPELQIGTYEVSISKENFERSITSAIKVDVAAEVRVDAISEAGLGQSVGDRFRRVAIAGGNHHGRPGATLARTR